MRICGNFTYDAFGSFSEGLAWAMKDGKCFHIWRNGSPAYEARFERVGNFFGGRAQVMKNGEWFYIRPDGSRVY